jgi:hypothetical protein
VREREERTIFGDTNFSYEAYALSSDELIESNMTFVADINSMPWMEYDNATDI